MRRELFALHLPNPERVRGDYAALAELSKGLSGGDILDICLNAIYTGSADSNPRAVVGDPDDDLGGDCQDQEGEGGALAPIQTTGF